MTHKTVLFVLGSHATLQDGTSPTDVQEAAHPYYAVSPHFGVEWASIKGGAAPLDQDSVEAFKEDKECQRFLKDEKAQQGVKNTLKLSDIDTSKYAAVFVVGGHSPVFEASNSDAIRVYSSFWNEGKLVASVCHGPAALTEVKDQKGQSIFAGRTATGFTNVEEEQAGKTHQVPFLLEDRIKELGGKFEKAKEPWGVRVELSGQLLTGQNPASAAGVGEHIVEWVKSH